MKIQLEEAVPEQASQIGRIFYHAFKNIMEQHGLEPDIPSEEVGTAIMSARIGTPECQGFVALVDGRVAGANFYARFDSVAAVGPMIVDPAMQGLGLGRKLMQAAIDHAQSHGFERVRLLQDAINMVSMSLYTSLGFTVQEPIVLLRAAEKPEPVSGVRPLRLEDVEACSRLGIKLLGISRANEVRFMISHGPGMGVIPVGLERAGELQGYAVPGFSGHGVAHTNDDLLALVNTGMALSEGPSSAKWLCPSRNGDLFRMALEQGHRAVRGLHLMSIGPYETPSGSWFSSIEG